MVDSNIDYETVVRGLIERGLMVEKKQPLRFSIPDAKFQLEKGLRYFVGPNAQWLPQYDEVVEWMSDTGNKGLTLMGGCGLGKTVIGARIIPTLINYFFRYVVNTYDSTFLAKHPDTVIEKPLVMVDDIGVEYESVNYGERRKAFVELVDQCEKKGKFLIVTTNMNTNDLREKYGDRTLDRLKALTKCIVLEGESLRN